MDGDSVTALLRRALLFLLVKHPTRTSLGLAGGVFVGLVADLFKDFLPTQLNLSALGQIPLSISGAFVANLPSAIKKDRLPEDVEQQFQAIARAVHDGGLSKQQQKLLYQSLAQRIISETKVQARNRGRITLP
jgi:hypothetical protein